jgi:aryl-alcohol dehydrogenase-like predicted oxidoreductase
MDTQHRINGIPTRMLGSTGARITILGVGGYHIGKDKDAQLGIRIIRTAIDEGINFLDNAWCYNGGLSERIMGLALRDGYRDRVFLMTKNHGRDAATFDSQLEDSLHRLQTDCIDLVQFHEVIHDDIPRRIYSGGAIEAAVRAREAGKLRFIGFTGHRWPRLHQEMLEGDFPWDTVQFPANLLDAQFRSFTRQVLPILKTRSIGAIGMKSLAGGQLLQTGVSASDAIGYALSLPIDTLVSGMDSIAVLRQNLETVRAWSPQDEAQQRALLDAVAAAAEDGHLERYKTA